MNTPTLRIEISDLRREHPRLLLSAEASDQLKNRRRTSLEARYWGFLSRRGEALRELPPVRYEKKGLRLLHISREVLTRIQTWALLYRVEGKEVYRNRILQEMEAVADFPDWNPSHFLDVGEMAMAFAIGLDWLWEELESNQRQALLQTLFRMAIEPSLDEENPYNWWIKYQNNWNPVCHSGLIAAAILYADEDPSVAEYVIQRAVKCLPTAQAETDPDGVYPEGPTYWKYGTHFTAIAISLLNHAFGKSFGLQDHESFQKSVEFHALSVAPTGSHYNYYDSGDTYQFAAVTAFFAAVYENPVAIQSFRKGLEALMEYEDPPDGFNVGREIPMIAVWDPFLVLERFKETQPDLPTVWQGRGENPVVFIRESFQNPESFFLGYKGGNARVSHAHMDSGSFIYEDEGVRWAIDLGMQNYMSLESKGVGIWDRRQEGDRWRIFRLGPYSHNQLLIEDQLHQIKGRALLRPVETSEDLIQGTADLTELFPNLIASYQRHYRVHQYKVLEITDEITGLRIGGDHESRYNSGLHWRMLTRATVHMNTSTALLCQGGKLCYLKIANPDSLDPFQFLTQPVDPPPQYWDEYNPGVSAIDLWLRGDESGKRSLTILLSTDPDALAEVESALSPEG